MATEGIRDAYETGKGSITVRGRAYIEGTDAGMSEVGTSQGPEASRRLAWQCHPHCIKCSAAVTESAGHAAVSCLGYCRPSGSA